MPLPHLDLPTTATASLSHSILYLCRFVWLAPL